MTKWITLKEAAAKYDTDARNIKGWGQKGMITVSRIGEVWMVDDDSITSYLEKTKKIEHLQKELVCSERRLANSIETNEERLFLVRSFRLIESVFVAVLEELARVIQLDEYRHVFMSVAKGYELPWIAERMGISKGEVTRMYAKAIREVRRKYIGEKNWYDEKAEMIQELNRTKMKLSNVEDKLALLLKTKEETASLDELRKNISQSSQPLKISDEDLAVLFIRLNDVDGFDTRTKNAFRRMDLTTIQDLLRFIKKNGLEKMINTSGFGLHCLKMTQKQLEKMGLLDERGRSPYFPYIDIGHEGKLSLVYGKK